jgi:glucose-1-phosphate thymidylyltransferase
MLADINVILIISTAEDTPVFIRILGDGSKFGISFQYAVQETPRGLADAFIVGADFIGNDSVCLILGDNIFYGNGLSELLRNAVKSEEGATVFGYYVNDPERYGVVEFNKDMQAVTIEEKPLKPKSNYAVVGLYFYDNNVVDIAANLKPSSRGEIEITDINKEYLRQGKLKVEIMNRGFAWLDTGTHESMHEASTFVKIIEDRSGLKIACIEEIAYQMGFINETQLRTLAEPLMKSGYGQYLINILEKM